MSIGVSGSSESHRQNLTIHDSKVKKGILAGALAGTNVVVTFDQTSTSPILESGKSVSGLSSSRRGGKGLGIRTSSAGRSKKARSKSAKKSGKSKKSGTVDDIEETSGDEEEIDEIEEKSIEAIQETGDFQKEDQQEEKRKELFDRLEKMARSGPITDLQDIIDTAWGKKGVYEDVTEAYDGLRASQEYFGTNDQEVLKNLSNSTRAAGDVLYKENAPDIRAGYLFGPGTDATTSYREYVLRFEKVSDTFKAIMEKAQGESRLFTKEIDKLIKGIQIDIKAQESTLDPSHLRQIMQGLFTVQICSQLEKECGLLLRDMQSFYGAEEPVAIPFMLDISASIKESIDAQELDAQLIKLQKSLSEDLGVPFPKIHLKLNDNLSEGDYQIMIQEEPVAEGTLKYKQLLVREDPVKLEIPYTEETQFLPGIPSIWVADSFIKKLDDSKIPYMSNAEILSYHLALILRKNAADFLGTQETKSLLKKAEPNFPDIVREVQRILPIQKITEVFQRMIQEDISIKNLKILLQALINWGPKEKDPVILTEYARASLKRYISHKFSQGKNTLAVYLLDPNTEDAIRKAVKQTSEDNPQIDSQLTMNFVNAVKEKVGNLSKTTDKPVLLTSKDIRPHVRKLIESEIYELPVLSHQELTEEITTKPLGTISL